MIRLLMFNGYDNVASIIIRENGKEIDLTPVNRVVLKLGQITVDSSTNPDAIHWSGNRLNFALGGIGVPAGDHDATVVIYDPSHDDGQVVISPQSTARLIFTFVDV